MRSHSAHVVVRKKKRKASARRTKLLVVRTQKRLVDGSLTEPEVRFIAGSNRDHPDERPCDTMRRKLRGETGLETKSCGKRLEPKTEGDGHVKNAILIESQDCTGELRRGKPIEVAGKVISAPEYMDIGEVRRLISPAHRWVMAAVDREVYGKVR